MLRELHIRNFALIESVDLLFAKGFTVFTGETGSGKSIILGALNLILGERADYTVIRNQEEKTVVEAVFSLDNKLFGNFFQINDLDFLPETIIRREINAKGKTRAFINDTPVQLNVLQNLTSQLLKIHSQYHTYSLKNKDFQLNLLDNLSHINTEGFQLLYKEWNYLKREIHSKEEQLLHFTKEADYINFQLEELKNAKLDVLHYEAIEQELTQLQNAGEILQQFSNIEHTLEDEQGVIALLNILRNQLNKSASLHTKLSESKERLDSVILELKDISNGVTESSERLTLDPETQQLLTEQVNLFNKLLQKHQVSTQEELIEIRDQYAQQSDSNISLEEELLQLKNQFSQLEKSLYEEADQLHQQRLSAKPLIEKELISLLGQLKLENSKVDIQLRKTEVLNELGQSEVSILFSPNKGVEPKPIDKTASGGELSRFMLCLERMLSEKMALPTLILDEIDTGVSGDVALKMGQMLNEMGKNMQLFAITHLPQVAAKGQNHFKVFKEERGKETKTFVSNLTYDERLLEIAGLMSGEEVNDAAIANAKILMQ